MLSGTGSVYLDDAFARKKGMRYICARHEAAAVAMAEAAAKLKNTIGVSVVTTGPGGANAIPGAIEAWVDSVPMLIISGQVKREHYIKDRAFGIQGFNIIDNVKNFTKYSVLLTDPNLIRYHLERAVYEARSGRPGPAWIDIPMDLQSTEVDVDNLPGFLPLEQAENKKNSFNFDSFVGLLSSSKRPVVAFGKGVKLSESNERLINFLESFNIPAVSARMANDVMPFSHNNYFGMAGIRGRRSAVKVMKNADLLIILGSSACHTFFGLNGEGLANDCKLVVVDIDKKIFKRKDLDIHLGIQTDLNKFFDYFEEKQSFLKEVINFKSWLDVCHDIKYKNPTVTEDLKENPINSYYLAECLGKLTGPKHIFTNDAGSSNYISSQALELNNGQRELTSGAFYTMGLTLPLAIGAAVTEPDSQIIAITGDGSIELNIQELQTINLNNLNIKIFVINNGGYASIRDSQDAMCGGRYTDDEQILNFKKIAHAFDLEFEIIQSADELESSIKNVLSNDKPTLIEVVCDSNQYMIEPIREMEENL